MASLCTSNRKRRLLFIAVPLLTLIGLSSYFQCYYRQVKIVEMYCDIMNEFFVGAKKPETVTTFFPFDAWGLRDDSYRKVYSHINQNHISLGLRSIPPSLYVKSRVSSLNLLTRRLEVVVALRYDFGFDEEVRVYHMRYSKGRWRIEKVTKGQLFKA